ncbi:hypothetical protein BKA82DRAFT_4125978, partial [Pisolithus tinctorius]
IHWRRKARPILSAVPSQLATLCFRASPVLHTRHCSTVQFPSSSLEYLVSKNILPQYSVVQLGNPQVTCLFA